MREAAFRLFPLTYTASRTARRATLDPAGSQRKLRAHRCWLFDMKDQHSTRTILDVMAAPVAATHVFNRGKDVDGRDKPGHDGVGA